MRPPLSARQKLRFFVFLAGLFVLALILVPRLPAPQAAGAPLPTAPPSATPTPDVGCQADSQQFIARLDPLLEQWIDERQLADRAPLDQLGAQVEKLRGVQQQIAAVKPPICAAGPYRGLLGALDLYLKAYDGFVAQLPEESVRRDLDAAKAAFREALDGVNRLRRS